MKRFFGLWMIVLSLSVLLPRAAFAYHAPSLTLSIYHQDGTLQSSFSVETANEAGGAKVAAEDLGNDGTPEIIMGMGLGNEPRVSIYRLDGSVIDSFLAYDAGMGTGITVAACDVNGDGVKEIITGTQYGGGPQVGIWGYDGNAWQVAARFFAYDELFRGGVNVSCGDVDGDGAKEIITTPGPSGGPHVKIWKSQEKKLILSQEFFPFAQEETGGVLSSVHDGKVFVTLQKTTGAHIVKSYVIHSPPELVNVQTNTTVQTSALFFADDELVLGSLQDGYIVGSTTFVANLPFGSVSAAAADIDADGDDEILTIGDRPLFSAVAETRIEIDLSEQRLYAYEDGILANSFLISSARSPWITPVGAHSVLAKLPYVDYTWSYGPGNPENYSLGLVPYNLRIYPHIYIHYAYWHNNFGHPMSHGCVNVNLENMKWIYDFAEEGIPVEVRA